MLLVTKQGTAFLTVDSSQLDYIISQKNRQLCKCKFYVDTNAEMHYNVEGEHRGVIWYLSSYENTVLLHVGAVSGLPCLPLCEGHMGPVSPFEQHLIPLVIHSNPQLVSGHCGVEVEKESAAVMFHVSSCCRCFFQP